MSKIADKISTLETLLNQKETKLKKKITNTLIIYAVLVAVVAGYTLWIVPKLKEITSTQAMTEIILTEVSELLSKMRTNFTDEVHANSSVWAVEIVKQSIEAIPQVEEPLLEKADAMIDYLAQHLENQLIPSFTDFLRENSVELRERYAEFKDEEMMQGLSLIFVETIETEIDQYLNDYLIKEISHLRNQIRQLNQGKKILTKRDEAQRNLIVSWVYLTENHADEGSILSDCLSRVKDRCMSMFTIENMNVKELMEAEPEDVEGVGEVYE